MVKVEQSDLLKTYAGEYQQFGFVDGFAASHSHHRPIFTELSIIRMLEDPRICFGLELIKGPIHSNTKFFTQEESENSSVHRYIAESQIHFPYVVKSERKEVSDFVTTNLRRFWQVGSIKALSAIEWGYSGHEVMYRERQMGRRKVLMFDNLYDYQARDVSCVTVNGGVTGIVVNPYNTKNFYLGIPKAFWHVHAREANRYYGQSRLKNAYAAWWEIWTEGGARDVRRQWYYRNAYDGGTMYYPIGEQRTGPNTVISNRDLALEMMSKKRSGGYLIFPNQLDQNNKPKWDYTPPVAGVTPQGLPEYMQSLTDEELEGLGIPPEVVQGDGGGLGSASGRKIPMMAFYSSLQKVADFLISDFQRQVVDYLLALSFPKRTNLDYTVEPLIPIKAYDDELGSGPGGPTVPNLPDDEDTDPSSSQGDSEE